MLELHHVSRQRSGLIGKYVFHLKRATNEISDDRSDYTAQSARPFTIPNSSFKFDVLATAGVSESLWYMSMSMLMNIAC